MSQSAQQAPQVSQPVPATTTDETQLTLDEMTRVMDVARTLRKERSIAERELNREETVELLRRKLREAADLAGDPVTDEQIDTAIKNYFENLHEFDPPEEGLETTLAGVYVRRKQIAGWLLAIAAAAMLVWGSWYGGMLPGKRQAELRAQQTYSQVEEAAGAIEKMSTSPEATAAAEAARAEAAAYRDRSEVSALEQLRDQLLQQQAVIKSEYRLMIANDGQSGVPTYSPQGNLSGYYLIVEATDANGKPVTVRVRNAESGKYESVSRWAEQVPKEVYDRVQQDKEADGIVDAREFAVKRRGETELKVTFPGVSGSPLERGRQITEW